MKITKSSTVIGLVVIMATINGSCYVEDFFVDMYMEKNGYRPC